ncbi:uncharacterized protein BDR25DRAFT_344941 [Lindgomyces ingoldianus]|uniref:Uncharacterized protein n=1 Tax=Lindgomyces ingoldianus TaxID=673940 RepID=A0ACB6QJG7_9PLEO|nr:uncharacterized protein BDR25DRAFT_344941 [Lindgomyces ingoldianus]KAF2467143.1 hypothetical protein BDR25DRAFT_344941 [Lindgomyces ingoldianus]
MNHNAVINLSGDDIKTLETLRARLMPLAYNLQQLQNEIAASPDGLLKWPTVQRASSLLNSHLSTIQKLISENSELLQYLYPYPVPPFPAERLEGLSAALVRKKPEPGDEKWILERLKKAAEFCEGVDDFGVDVKKDPSIDDQDIKMKDDDDDDGDDADDEDGNRKRIIGGVKRVKGNLSQNDITALWNSAGKWVFDTAIKDEESSDDEQGGDASSSEPSPTEDKEMKGMQPTSIEAAQTEALLPLMKLGTILKFMETGDIVVDQL